MARHRMRTLRGSPGPGTSAAAPLDAAADRTLQSGQHPTLADGDCLSHGSAFHPYRPQGALCAPAIAARAVHQHRAIRLREQRIEGQHVLPGEIRRAGKRKVRVAESRGAYDRSLVEIGSLRVRSQVDDMADARIAEPLDLARPNAS